MTFNDLKGHTIRAIEVSESKDEIKFTLDNGQVYRLYHMPDCCESVEIESIVGDLENLIDTPLTMADEVESSECQPGQKTYEGISFTWTFYKLATVKGYVDIRWYGESNGYYSESVSFEQVGQDD